MAALLVNRAGAVIVGGGFAGLSAAVRLAKAGRHVVVFEARSRLGGRATAFKDRETGEWVDNGQHVLLGCYRETLAFLADVGASGNVRAEAKLSVDVVDGRGLRSRLACPSLPSPWHLLAGAFNWPALGWSDRLSLLRMAAPLRAARRQISDPSVRAASESETAASWLARCGQTARTSELLWHPLALAALNQPADQAAAPPFARVLAEMFGGRAADAAIVLPTKPLHLAYAEPARSFIEQHGGVVATGVAARVRIEDGEATVTAGGEPWRADTVIVAVPWFALAATLEGDRSPVEDTLAAAAATPPSPIVTVNLWYDRPVVDVPFLGLPGRTLQWVFDKRAAFGRDTAHLSLVASGAPELLSRANPELIATADRELRAALPAARQAHLLKGTVIREPRATFSLAPGSPRRPPPRTAVRGLWLAGDWIETGLPATIESAVRSGHAAADQILKS